MIPDVGRVTEWPARVESAPARSNVAVVTVNYNTRVSIAQLIYSVCARLRNPQVAQLVVVDNASIDGSRRLLERMADAGLCVLLGNDENRYHGPALNQAMNWLARRQVTADSEQPIDYVWVLDSDCVIIREDTLAEAISALLPPGAALAGQAAPSVWHSGEMLGMYSLLLDPGLVWRDPIPPFDDSGMPSHELQLGCVAAGLSCVDFPFTREGFIVHRGRSSLAQVLARGETDNKHYRWAVDHHEPHFNAEPGASDLYQLFQAEFAAVVGDAYHDDAIVDACLAVRAR